MILQKKEKGILNQEQSGPSTVCTRSVQDAVRSTPLAGAVITCGGGEDGSAAARLLLRPPRTGRRRRRPSPPLRSRTLFFRSIRPSPAGADSVRNGQEYYRLVPKQKGLRNLIMGLFFFFVFVLCACRTGDSRGPQA
jgi:hypothetical protein